MGLYTYNAISVLRKDDINFIRTKVDFHQRDKSVQPITFSLMCVKKHKEESGCSGLRDKTAFVALSKFDEMNLLNDYRFLEDTTRLAGSSSRDNLIRTPHMTFKAKKLTACARKMNITLKFLPMAFTKSRDNSTMFLTKCTARCAAKLETFASKKYEREKRFLWHLKLNFPQSNTGFSERRVSDGKTIEQILTPYVHPSKSDPVRRQKLKMYAQTTFEEIKVFMRVEGGKANSLRYHELDLGKTLRDNLSSKMLIEYPVLHVALRSHFQDYPLTGPAEPMSDCSRLATGEDHGTNKVAQALPSCARQGLSASPVKQMVTDEIKPPWKKRAKREVKKGEELEEGELTESSEDGGEQGEERDGRNIEDCHTEDKSLIQTCLNVADGMGPVNTVSNAENMGPPEVILTV